MQGFLSRDGMPPAELLAAGRAEVRRLRRRAHRGSRWWAIDRRVRRSPRRRRRLSRRGGSWSRPVSVDELPDIPGVRERWGRDLLHCPYCHGWEVRDQPLGVLGTGPGSVHHAQLVRQWSDDVVFFAHTYDLTASRARAARRTRDPGRRRAQVDAAGGRGRPADRRRARRRPRRSRATAVFIRPRAARHADGLRRARAASVDEAGFVTVDATGRTTSAAASGRPATSSTRAPR